jgi:hypothetical protein
MKPEERAAGTEVAFEGWRGKRENKAVYLKKYNSRGKGVNIQIAFLIGISTKEILGKSFIIYFRNCGILQSQIHSHQDPWNSAGSLKTLVKFDDILQYLLRSAKINKIAFRSAAMVKTFWKMTKCCFRNIFVDLGESFRMMVKLPESV